MPTRLLVVLCILFAMPAMAQNSAPASFTQIKTKIDSITRITDEIPPMERSVFSGNVKGGRYRVECYVNKTTKEILKTNFLVITDSMNYNKVYYFKGNHVIKLNYNDKALYYQSGERMYNAEGQAVNEASLKKLMDLVTDNFQGLYTALFQ